MSELLFQPEDFQKTSLRLSTAHECKLARDLWPGLSSLVKGKGENYSLLVLGLCEIKRQAGLKGEMGEKKHHPLLKSELINYQQKLAHEVRERAKMHECISLHQQSAFINLSVLVEGQIILRNSTRKRGILPQDSRTGTSPSPSALPYLRTTKQSFSRTPAYFHPIIYFPIGRFPWCFSRNFYTALRKGGEKLLHC